jgi:CRP-like cAMP-binding protein
MREARLLRIGREIFLAGLGMPLDTVDSWVIDRLTAVLGEQEVRKGQTLFSAGETSEFLYFMQDGHVRLTREGGPSWTFHGRWLLGAFEALGERPAAHTATALADFHSMRVHAPDWVELLEDSFQLARQGVTNLSRAIAMLEQRIATEAPVSPRATPVLSAVPAGTLSMVERLALLLDVRMLRGAGVQTLADLAAVSEQVSFATGDHVLDRGGERQHLICILDGEVAAERTVPDVARRYGPGDLVCGAAIVGGVAAPWQAVASAPVRAIAIPLEGLFDLMEEHFDLVRSVLSALGARRELLLDHLAAPTGDVVLT